MDANRKIAVVTGGSRGIGRGIALQLAKDGYDIALCYRDAKKEAEYVKNEIETLSRRAFVQRCDAGNFEEARSFIETVNSELGLISVLVNNAGIVKDRPLVMMPLGEWCDILNTNLGSVFNFCRSVIFDFMKRKEGKIINISSVSGIYGNATQTNYSASKAGIIGFSKSLSKEVGYSNICVNVVAPGFIETEMTNNLSEKQRKDIVHRCALKKMGRVEDVAHIVSFLASEKANYITGQVFIVDGGLSL